MADVVERYRIVGENAVGAAFNQILRQSKSTADRMASVFKTAFAGVSLLSLANITRQAIDRADAIGTLADSFGTTAEELSRLDYVAKQSNTSLEEITSGLTAFQKNLVLAGEDSGRARKALAALNIEATDLARLPLPQQLATIADRFKAIQNPTERVRIAAQLFGDEVGRRLIPVLSLGREGIQALGLESDRLGNTLTREAVAKLKLADEAIKRFEASTNSLKTSLAIGVTPTLEKLANTLAKVFNPGPELAISLYEDALIRMDQKAKLLGTTLEEAAGAGSETARIIAGIRSRIDQLRGNTGPSNPRGGIFQPLIEGAEVTQEEVAKARGEIEALIGPVSALRVQFEAQKTKIEELAVKYPELAGAAGQAIAAITRDFKASIIDAQYELVKLEVLEDRMRSARSQPVEDAPIAGNLDEENTRAINATMHEIIAANVELRSRVVEVDGEFFEVNESAKTLMETLKDESARRAVGYISDAIMGLDDGARNFAKGMIDAFRRILADKAAQQLMAWFEGLGQGGGSSGGGFLGSLLGGLFGGFGSGGIKLPPGSIPTVGPLAGGGFIPPGAMSLVGERGPEIAMAGPQGATIIPFSKGGSQAVHVTYAPVTHVDARGASVELVRELPRILAESNRRAVDEAEARIVTKLQRRQYRGL